MSNYLLARQSNAICYDPDLLGLFDRIVTVSLTASKIDQSIVKQALLGVYLNTLVIDQM